MLRTTEMRISRGFSLPYVRAYCGQIAIDLLGMGGSFSPQGWRSATASAPF